MMTENPSGETLKRQHHNLGERDTHLPSDSRSGSDSGGEHVPGRRLGNQGDPPNFTSAADGQQSGEEPNQDTVPGRNVGLQGAHPEKVHPRTAYDVKAAHRALDGIADDDLQQIPIVPTGSRLEQGAKYLDLRHPEQGEFTAMGNQAADDEHWYVPKSDVPYQLWNRLIGVQNPERRGDESESTATP